MRTIVAGPSQSGKTALCRSLAEEQNAWFLNLDPARQEQVPLGCAGLFRPGGAAHGFRFIGALTLARDPLAAIKAICYATRAAGDSPLICEITVERPSPVLVHSLRAIAEVLRPCKLISVAMPNAALIFQTPESSVEGITPELVKRRPASAAKAWRKAVWKSLFVNATIHKLPLSSFQISGARYGSGKPVAIEDLRAIRTIGMPSALSAEISNAVLTIVASGEFDNDAIHSAVDYLGCETAHVVEPKDFDGLLCGFENRLGEHFGIARIIGVDFAERSIALQSSAVAPWPVAILHVGHLCLDDNFNELGHIRPWQV